jgi:hypothetical protein
MRAGTHLLAARSSRMRGEGGHGAVYSSFGWGAETRTQDGVIIYHRNVRHIRIETGAFSGNRLDFS